MNGWRIAAALVLGALLVSGASAGAERKVLVQGYTRSDGTYVRPHLRALPGTAVPAAASSTPVVAAPADPVVRGTAAEQEIGRTGSVPLTLRPELARRRGASTAALPTTPPPASGRRIIVSADSEALPPWLEPYAPPKIHDPILAFQMKQAEKGVPESEYAMGMRYLTGNGVPRNEEMGRELIHSAAKHGSLRALDKMYEIIRADRARARAAREKPGS